ncbi:hypothetical protein bsdE14_00190 [Clostridium omnivorum]|uniref:Uncharacterized protein n=1 Tax=Clostridium omnivorum TaxID=1604902 RepID=A0ABQ5N081_9CLOT|nr:hypothetical protein bsdE14_00190 [Clostridium sp. E14]
MDIAIKVSVCPTGNVKDDLFKKIPVVKIADGSCGINIYIVYREI